MKVWRLRIPGWVALLLAAGGLAGGWVGAQETEPRTEVHPQYVIERDADVPDLPFADNPDPTVCGIPEPWRDDPTAYLSGVFDGEMIQPTVFLYDSHARRSIKGRAPHGAEVEIVLSQSNPVLNYYLVRTVGDGEVQEGWIPAPFLSFEPPEG